MSKISDAETRANLVYDEATNSLMAHSIRGAQSYIFKKTNSNRNIIVRKVPQLEQDCGRRSYYAGTSTHAVICVDAVLAPDYQRICIAHELYHFLVDFDPTITDVPNDGELEDYCDLFATRLCQKYHQFYTSGQAVDAGRFNVTFPVRANPVPPCPYVIGDDGICRPA